MLHRLTKIGFRCRTRELRRRCLSHKIITQEVSPELLVNASMGWGQSFNDNDALCDFLWESNAVTSERVLLAMRQLDRKWFTPQWAAELAERANPQKSAASIPFNYYEADKPIKIGCGATMSTSQAHAQALDLLAGHLQPGATALDVGSGTGYITACMAHMVHKRGGSAMGLEHMKQLVVFASGIIDRLNAQPPKGFEESSPFLRCDFRCLNAISEFPLDKAQSQPMSFQCIHFGAAMEDIPNAFFDALACGGRLLAPIGRIDEEQILTIFDRATDGSYMKPVEITKTTFSPLYKQREDQWQDRTARLAQVTADLNDWRDEFALKNGGRSPSAKDLAAMPLFQEFQKLRRALKK